MAIKKALDMATVQEALAKTRIIPVRVCDEMSKSFISYAMAVNVSRAIPDVRDGLKPVHRRILYAMNDMGNTYDKPFKKCARIVGEVLGKYHPHGDSAVYEALVRLAQPFSIRATLVDGQGNFGSVDGDPPAAQRYTEARLSKIANEMLRDLDKETVDFYPNFDDTLMQPVVLPARYPNLLVNGSEGIAVGMATSIPPHNLGEVIDGTIALLDNPDLTSEDLMEYIPCPDYPTGGLILGRAAIRQAYTTGKGGIVIRSKTEIEEHNGKFVIAVTEIPYQVNKAMLIKNIAEQVKDKKLVGISDIHEESDRFGMRIAIDIKRDANPQVVLNSLFKQTQLQVTTGITFLALVNNEPKICTLKDMLSEYIKHQIEVTERKIRYQLGKALEREHIVKGLVIALANIDEVIATIKQSEERSDAMNALMEKFELSDKQANAVLEMKLSRLAHLEVEKLNAELTDLDNAIADYRDILAKPERVHQIIREDLTVVKNTYADKRRSELSYDASDIDLADLIAPEEVVISMTYKGYAKRMSVAEYRTQGRGGVGVTAHKMADEDFVSRIFTCNTHDDLLFFTNFGKVYCLKAYEVPDASKQAKGRAIVNFLQLSEGEKVTALLSVKDYAEGYMIMATKMGLIKKCAISEFEKIRKTGKIAITLQEGDELIVAELTTGNDDVLMASSSGKCIRFSENDVRKTGRGSMGVKSINLDEGEVVVDMAIVDESKEVITISEYGYGKRTDTDEYRTQGRAGKGIKAGVFTDKTGGLVNLKLAGADEDIIIIADNGTMIRLSTDKISKIGRNTQGVRLMKFRADGKVAAVALTPHEEVDESEEEIAAELQTAGVEMANTAEANAEANAENASSNENSEE